MIGTADSARTVRHTSKPSTSGSMRSSRIRSGCSAREATIACSPVRATAVSYPSFRRLYVRVSARVMSSSATRIFVISSEPAGDIVLCPAIFGRVEDLCRLAVLDELADIVLSGQHERREIRDACCLLHVVGHNDHRVVLLQGRQQL